MRRPFRSAIIGTGRIAGSIDDEIVHLPDVRLPNGIQHSTVYVVRPISHAGAYKSVPGFELVAAANRSKEKLDAFGARWDVSGLYTDYKEMLRVERPEVVSICTQTPAKAEATIAAAESGALAIVVEKALATSLDEADAMLDACSRSGTVLVTDHPRRFSPMYRRVKGLITEGAIGELGSISAFCNGGMIHNGTHLFDLLRFWFGDAMEVSARFFDYQPGADCSGQGIVRFSSNLSAFVDFTHPLPFSLEIHGTTGRLFTSDALGSCRMVNYEVLPLENPVPKAPRVWRESPIDPGPCQLSTMQILLGELKAELDGGPPVDSTGEDGRAALEIALAFHASHEAGKCVKLPLQGQDRMRRVASR